MKNMDTFAKRVVARRKELQLTQNQLAELSGLKQPDISKIELGRILSTTQIVPLAKALRCDPSWLLTGEAGAPTAANGLEPVGYSTEALALAWLLDQVTNRLDKTVANNAATAAILSILQKMPEGSTHKQDEHAKPPKQNA
jgi:transcriptional regulator with XRE-family HTH domain